MAKRRASKKRNALLVFELLTKEASRRVIAGDNDGARQVVALIKEAFAPGSELHRELRLARSLYLTKVSSPAVAAHILTEARSASNSLDVVKLHAEKTNLIARIEREIDQSGSLYEDQHQSYRLLSTIGTLLSDWRSNDKDLGRIAQYEDQLMEHLTSPASPGLVLEEDPSDKMSTGERRALIAIMSRKLEDKWGRALTKDQKSLLREYVLAKNPNALLERIRFIKSEALKCLDSCRSMAEKTDYFVGRVDESKNAILAQNIDEVNDETVGLGLLYLKLIAEATNEEQR
jgi:hypothetical protein